MSWFLKAFRNYAGFSGRARRTEYWMFGLYLGIIGVIIFTLDFFLGTFPIILALVYLAMILPGLAVSVRRLHDTGKSGWWYFINFVPLVGSIILLVFMCQDSVEDNQYGPNPKVFENPNHIHNTFS